ncbi:hypothetical protein PO909_009399 [Leuciscus waleckii]
MMATARRSGPAGRSQILDAPQSMSQSPTSADRKVLDKVFKRLEKLHKLSTDPRLGLKNSPPYLPELVSETATLLTEVWAPYRGSMMAVPRGDEGDYLRIHIRHLLDKTDRAVLLFKDGKEKMFEETSSYSGQDNMCGGNFKNMTEGKFNPKKRCNEFFVAKLEIKVEKFGHKLGPPVGNHIHQEAMKEKTQNDRKKVLQGPPSLPAVESFSGSDVFEVLVIGPDDKSSSQRCLAHKGPQKDVNNVKSCLKLLNEAGENIPRFVSHYLDELPTVTFNSLDISCLLGKIERVSTDISAMKQAMSAQTNICEDLRLVTAGINQRLCVIEQPEPGGGDASISQVNVDPARSRAVHRASSDCGQSWLDGESSAMTAAATRIGEEALSRSVLSAGPMVGASALDVGVVEGELDVRLRGGVAVSPAWSRVVKEGRRLKYDF